MEEETLKMINEKIRKYLKEEKQASLLNAVELIRAINNPLYKE